MDWLKGRTELQQRSPTRGYLHDNPDWLKFTQDLSGITGSALERDWLHAAKANAKRWAPFRWADELAGTGRRTVTVMVGASPSLEKNWEALKSIQGDPQFTLIAVSSGLRFLLDKGIRPKYVMQCDVSTKTTQYLEGLDTTGLTLIGNTFSCPQFLEQWKGSIYFLPIGVGTSRRAKRLYARRIERDTFFPPAGNQYNFGVMFAYLVLESRAFILCGVDYSYGEKYYAGKSEAMKDKWKKAIGPIPDIHGQSVYTVAPLYQAKLALEHLSSMIPGTFINATEGGILGVSARHGYLKWITQMPLLNAISLSRYALAEANRLNGGSRDGRLLGTVPTLQYGCA